MNNGINTEGILTIEKIRAMMDLLPPAPPPQKIYYSPNSNGIPGLEEIKKLNKNAFGNHILPLVESPFMPTGIVALVTYGPRLQNGQRCIEDVQIYRLSEDPK